MALPTVERSWQFDVNNINPTQADAITCTRTLILNIKNALIGFASVPWTVVSSSDGTTAGAGDLWDSIAKLNWSAGVARSWIVLQHPAGFQVCWDLNYTGWAGGAHVWYISVSRSGAFTGGTASARPTAVDEHVLGGQQIYSVYNGNVRTVWHLLHSAAGTRLFIHYNNAHSAMYVWESLADCVVGLSTPYVQFMSASAGVQAFAFLGSDAVFHRQGSVNYAGRLTSEGHRTQNLAEYLGAYPNEIDSTWTLYPIGFCSSTGGIRGRHGRLVDMWLGPTAVAEGSAYPGDGSRQFVQISGFVVPWNGTLPTIA